MWCKNMSSTPVTTRKKKAAQVGQGEQTATTQDATPSMQDINKMPLPGGYTVETAMEVYEKCQKDIVFFAQHFFPHIVNVKAANFHHEVFNDLLEAKFYACAAPRGHAKSTLGLVIYSMHYALFRSVGDVSLLSASESFVINEIVRLIKREFETNERLKIFFGEMKTAKWSETYFVLKNGVAFEAGGIGGQLRGGRRGLICLDDLESNESVESEEQREKLRNRINKELIPKLLPKGQMIYFGTLISPLCYLKRLLENQENGWSKRIYDCYVDGVEAEGHELWPEMLPHAELQRRKAIMGTNAFQAEYRNNPISEATAAIKDNMIRHWTELPTQMSVVLSVDPAYSEDPKADPKVCSVVGCDQHGNRYLISYVRTWNPSGDFIDGILNMYLQHKNICTAVGLPKGGGDTEFWNSFMRRAEERHLNPPVVELKNTFTTAGGAVKRNKKARAIAALQPLFESGKYYIHASHIEAQEELLQLNPVTEQEHDDIIDTLAYAEQIVTPIFFDIGAEEMIDRRSPAMAGASSNYGMD